MATTVDGGLVDGVKRARTVAVSHPELGEIRKLDDRISYLPDEILVSFLCCLETEQSVRTSVLSRRWNNLWRYMTTLSFDFPDTGLYFFQDDSRYDNKCRRFVEWVNHVKEFHLATTIEDFSLVFCVFVAKTYKTDIDSWLSFALQKRAKRLSVNLMCPCLVKDMYSLGVQFIRNHESLVGSLVSLSLHSVDVSGEFLEYLLLVCPFLEELGVSHSFVLDSFTVSGPSLKLKHLNVGFCWNLKHLYIHNVNLVSLKYGGLPEHLVVKDTPRLVKASFCQFLDTPAGTKVLSHLPHLETLALTFFLSQEIRSFPEIPKLRNLRQLELVLNKLIFCARLCADLLEAFHFLNELKIVFKFLEKSFKEEKVPKLEHPHERLKVAELAGFIGCELDLGVALYIVENAPSLEKMVIDTRHPYADVVIDREEQQAARSVARIHLQTGSALGTRMVVI